MSNSSKLDIPKCPSCGAVGTTGTYGYKKCSNCGWKWNQKNKIPKKHQFKNDGQELEPVNVLKQLAFGNNPVTGEPLPADHLINMPCVNRALLLGTLTLSENNTEKEVSKPEIESRSIEVWNELEEQKLVDCFLQGQSVEDIRVELEKTPKSVRRKIHQFFGAPAKWLYPLPKEKKQEILDLTSAVEGKMDEACKQKINIIIGRPKNYMCAWTTELDTALVASFTEGNSVEKLMEVFGRNERSIQLRLEYLSGRPIEILIAASIEGRKFFFENTQFNNDNKQL